MKAEDRPVKEIVWSRRSFLKAALASVPAFGGPSDAHGHGHAHTIPGDNGEWNTDARRSPKRWRRGAAIGGGERRELDPLRG